MDIAVGIVSTSSPEANINTPILSVIALARCVARADDIYVSESVSTVFAITTTCTSFASNVSSASSMTETLLATSVSTAQIADAPLANASLRATDKSESVG